MNATTVRAAALDDSGYAVSFLVSQLPVRAHAAHGSGPCCRAERGTAARRQARCAGDTQSARECPPPAPGRRPGPAEAGDVLSAGLAVRRRARCPKQPELAALLGVAATTVFHAEPRRLRQGRSFWERADDVLGACGELLALHDAHLKAKAAAPSNSARLFGAALTARERGMAVLFAGGMAYSGIARELRVSTKSFRVHMSKVHAKAGSGGSSHIPPELLAAWLSEQDRQPVPAGDR